MKIKEHLSKHLSINDEMDRFIDKISWKKDFFKKKQANNIKRQEIKEYKIFSERNDKLQFSSYSNNIDRSNQKHQFSSKFHLLEDNIEKLKDPYKILRFNTSENFSNLLMTNSIFEFYKICESREVF